MPYRLHTRLLTINPSLFSSSWTAEKGQLALHVLALSASCQPIRDPRGRNLAQLLRKTSTDPVPRNRFSEATQLLALCSLGDRGRKLLDTAMTNIRELASESPAAVMDSIAMNVLAVACLSDNRIGGRSSAVYDALRPVAQLQKRDGSFGDIHTTGLVTQLQFAEGPSIREKQSLVNLKKVLCACVHAGTHGHLPFRGGINADVTSRLLAAYPRGVFTFFPVLPTRRVRRSGGRGSSSGVGLLLSTQELVKCRWLSPCQPSFNSSSVFWLHGFAVSCGRSTVHHRPTQALVAVDPDGEQLGWSRHKALAHIGRAQHSEGHFGSLLATAQVAPLLAGRTLADLASHATRYCSGRANGSETVR
ncbi:hypothetical protein HPB48_006908 [Haemaphysalis longicornis]|uniref:Uncharacterized protein n=1 Tax=Haemaphysalis longicornis TaxID=44386 RepID=A0A9J6FE87_HAELO|nr:hypothetical protein HPB48_006908 [Haemaphysalis longicornis]